MRQPLSSGAGVKTGASVPTAGVVPALPSPAHAAVPANRDATHKARNITLYSFAMAYTSCIELRSIASQWSFVRWLGHAPVSLLGLERPHIEQRQVVVKPLLKRGDLVDGSDPLADP